MTSPSMRLRKLSFVGKDVDPVGVEFDPGVNLIYGGSNAGKSYILRAINLVLGSRDPLDALDQGVAYHTTALTFDIGGEDPETLSRALKGGQVQIWPGEDPKAPSDAVKLKAKHDVDRDDNVSRYLLSKLGFGPSWIVKGEDGSKDPFTFRNLIPYVLVPEATMISDESPFAARRGVLGTFEKNLLRFILTGQDDSAVVTVPNAATLRAERGGQIKLIDEFMAEIERGLEPYPDQNSLQDELDELEESLETVRSELEAKQAELDDAVAKRRRLIDEQSDCNSRAAEIRLMLRRFADLARVYDSDIERLAALDENGFILQRFADQPCPLCGAEAEHQHIHVETTAIESQRASAAAEMRKLQRDRDDLKVTVASLEAEASGLEARVETLTEALAGVRGTIDKLRPLEASGRRQHQLALAERDKTKRGVDLHARAAVLRAKKEELEATVTGRQRADGLSIGVGDREQFQLTMAVKKVLEAWRYPVEAIAFDVSRQDIIVNGRARRMNGKGVMALLHSAIKVGILLHCKEKKLPHPGFLVLDSPLLSYRPPIMDKKHGALSADEKAMRATPLNEAFYEHLISIGHLAQITVIENSDPPASVIDKMRVTTFAGEGGSAGRQGLFPPLREPDGGAFS